MSLHAPLSIRDYVDEIKNYFGKADGFWKILPYVRHVSHLIPCIAKHPNFPIEQAGHIRSFSNAL